MKYQEDFVVEDLESLIKPLGGLKKHTTPQVERKKPAAASTAPQLSSSPSSSSTSSTSAALLSSSETNKTTSGSTAPTTTVAQQPQSQPTAPKSNFSLSAFSTDDTFAEVAPKQTQKAASLDLFDLATAPEIATAATVTIIIGSKVFIHNS